MGLAGTHVAVLTPLAGVRAADAGHAPGGERLQKSQRRPSRDLHCPLRGPHGKPKEKGTHVTVSHRDTGTRGQASYYSRLEDAAVVEDEVSPSKPHASLLGEQLQPHGAGGPCSEPTAHCVSHGQTAPPTPHSPGH